MDRELFSMLMKSSRGWTQERTDAYWERLESEPSNFADDHGPPWCPTRLFMPAWLTCSEFDRDSHTNFEEHALQSSTKPQELNVEKRQAMRKELVQGFGMIATPDRNISGMRLTPTSMTNIAAEHSHGTVGSLTLEIGRKQGVIGVDAEPNGPSGSGASTDPSSTAAVTCSTGGATKKFDVAATRIMKRRYFHKETLALMKKVESTIATTQELLKEGGGGNGPWLTLSARRKMTRNSSMTIHSRTVVR